MNRETGKAGVPRLQFLHLNRCRIPSAVIQKLTLQLNLKTFDTAAVEQLKKRLKSFRGDKKLAFDIYDTTTATKLSLISRKTKVSISTELLQLLDEEEWHYKLN